MPHWIIKAAIQGALSLVPGGYAVNDFLQTHVTRRLSLTRGRFEVKLSQCRRHLQYCFDLWGQPRRFLTILELGTGWYPIIPVGMYLCGASLIRTIDVVALLKRRYVSEVLRLFARYAAEGLLRHHLPWVREDRLAVLNDVLALARSGGTATELLRRLHIVPEVCDARHCGLADASIDLFVSNCVLEHIPVKDILGILREFRRLAAPGALLSNLVDLSDHYADFDPSITSFNFLKYSERTWRWLNSPLHFQNRLRITDYRDIQKMAGMYIFLEYREYGPKDALRSVRIAKEFERYPQEDLLVTRVWFVSAASRESVRCMR